MTAVVALGGNALMRPGQRGTAAERIQAASICPDAVVPERRSLLRALLQVERPAEQLHGPLLILVAQVHGLPVPLGLAGVKFTGGLGVDPCGVP